MAKIAKLLVVVLLAVAPRVVDGAEKPTTVPPNSIAVCEHFDFIGKCDRYTIEHGMRHLLVPSPAALKGQISSIAMAEGVTVWVFEGTQFSGKSAVLYRSYRALGPTGNFQPLPGLFPYPWVAEDNWIPMGSPYYEKTQTWNDRIRSFIVYREAPPVGVMVLRSGLGRITSGKPLPIARFFPLPESGFRLRRSFEHLHDFDNAAAVIHVPLALEVVLFAEPALSGKRLEIPGLLPSQPEVREFDGTGFKGDWYVKKGYVFDNWYPLKSYAFQNQVSSLIVRVRGWTIDMETPDRGTEGNPHKHRAPPAQKEKTRMQEPVRSAGPMEPRRGVAQLTLEPGMNRPGHDYESFPLAAPDAELCRKACATDRRCRAFTFVASPDRGAPARCWLKDAAPDARPTPGCTSGVKRVH